MAAGPSVASTRTVSSPSSSAIRDSANRTPLSRTRVEPLAASTPGASLRAPSISASARGPGSGSIGRRSQVTPPTTGRAP